MGTMETIYARASYNYTAPLLIVLALQHNLCQTVTFSIMVKANKGGFQGYQCAAFIDVAQRRNMDERVHEDLKKIVKELVKRDRATTNSKKMRKTKWGQEGKK